MRVLAIGAHPDDIEFGVGGILTKHRHIGDELFFLVTTKGESGGAESPEVRVAEAESAAHWLDAGVLVGNLPDTRVGEKAAIDLIYDVASTFAPDIVYSHSEHDTHQDHRTVALASRVSLRNIVKLYGYQAPSSTTDFKPCRFPNIDLFADDKLKLIAFHKSQAGQRRYLEEDYVMATARYWGMRAGGCTYSEPLEVIMDRDSAPDRFWF